MALTGTSGWRVEAEERRVASTNAHVVFMARSCQFGTCAAVLLLLALCCLHLLFITQHRVQLLTKFQCVSVTVRLEACCTAMFSTSSSSDVARLLVGNQRQSMTLRKLAVMRSSGDVGSILISRTRNIQGCWHFQRLRKRNLRSSFSQIDRANCEILELIAAQ